MAGPNLPKMAWRNLWRNRRRTLITLSSFAFGILLAVIFIGVGDYSYGQMIDLAARMGGGHVTLQHEDGLDTPSLKKTVAEASFLRKRALTDPDVDRAVVRISGAVMLATATKSYGAGFIAVDPAQEDPQSLSLLESIRDGEMFETATGDGLVLGATLAENLGATLGKKVVYTLTDKSGEIVSGLARVSGIVKTGSPSIDGAVCLLPIDTVRSAVGYDVDEAVLVAVFLRDQRKAPEVVERLQDIATGTTGAFTWKEVQPDLAAFISLDAGANIFFQLIIMILIAAGIFNSLFVSVMERMREFGIMMAVGFTPARLFGLVMWESLWLALVGIVAAAAVTAWPYYYVATRGIDFTDMIGEEGYEVSGVALEPIIYTDIYPEKLLYIGGIVVVVTLLAGLYPAWRAGRVVPVDSIKLV